MQIDVLRLPLFFTHFLHHNEHHKPLDFDDFLEEHLSENIHHDIDHDEHEKLPFHHHSDDFTIHQTQLALCNLKKISILSLSLQKNKVKCFYTQTFFPSNPFASIWRPPKLI